MCYNDVAGSYASLTFGISNSIAESTGFIVPLIVSALTKNVKLSQNLLTLYFLKIKFFESKHKKNGKLYLYLR